MTKKKEETGLAFARVQELNQSNALAPLNARRKLTTEERGIVDESFQQRLTMEAIRIKEQFAIYKVAQIHGHCHTTFDETVGAMLTLKDRPGRTKEHQDLLEQFTQHQVNLLARHLSSVLEVSVTQIGLILDESPYPPSKPPGFWRRLLG